MLYVDGASIVKGCGAGVALENPNRIQIEQSLQFNFKGSNNQAECEALIASLSLVRGIGVK